MFTIEQNGLCSLKRHGACTKSKEPVVGTTLYAKSNFYEDPFTAVDKCTHYREWDEDPHKASYCKEFTTLETCMSKERYYILNYENDGCTNNEGVPEKLVF
jgi:hypothetical protein